MNCNTILVAAALLASFPTAPAADELEQAEALGSSPLTAPRRARLYESAGWKLLGKGAHTQARDAFRRALHAWCQAGDFRARVVLSKKLCRPSAGRTEDAGQDFCRLAAADESLTRWHKPVEALPRRQTPLEDVDEKIFDLSEKVTALVREYRQLEDTCGLGQATALQARVAWAAGELNDALQGYREAADLFSQSHCAGQAAAGYRSASALAEAGSNLQEAYMLFARSLWEEAAEQAPERRRYCRSEKLDELCRRLGKPITCARLEKRALGTVLLKDFSHIKLTGSITRKEIDAVHEQGVTQLQLCLEEALDRGQISRGDSFELFWAVTNEGGSDRFRLSPEDAPEQLRQCLEQAVGALRYPQYRGQRQTVTLPLSLR